MPRLRVRHQPRFPIEPTRPQVDQTTLTITGTSNTLTTPEIASWLSSTDARGKTIQFGRTLRWNPNVSTTLTCDGVNLINKGKIEMHPANPGVVHLLRFTGITESTFAGSKALTINSATASNNGDGTYNGVITAQLRSQQTNCNYTTDDFCIVAGYTGASAAYNGTWPVVSVAAPSGTGGTQVVTVRITGAPPSPAVGTTGTIKLNDHQPNKKDIGLWTVEEGLVDLVGASPGVGWTRATASVSGSNPVITTVDDVSAWQVGDEIALTPTDASYDHFDDGLTVASVVGTTELHLTGSAGTGRHPLVSPEGWPYSLGCEVINLTRNVRIEGQDATHRSHTMFHSHQPTNQIVQNVQFRYMGPREGSGADPDLLVGRWPVHWHKNEDESVGTVVEGLVVRDSDSFAFVTHASNGITLNDCVAYNVTETPGWWDTDVQSDAPRDIVWDRWCIAKVKCIPSDATNHMGFQLSLLEVGRTGTLTNSVAVGVLGGRESSGIGWPENKLTTKNPADLTSEEWTVDDNVSHNNKNFGVFSWINPASDELHDVNRLVTYNNGASGIQVGAYKSIFRYVDILSYNNGWDGTNTNAPSGVLLTANTGPQNDDGFRPTFCVRDDLNGRRWLDAKHGALPIEIPWLFTDCILRNAPASGTVTWEEGIVEEHTDPKKIDFVRPWIEDESRDMTTTDINLIQMRNGARIRIQKRDNTAVEYLQPGTAGAPAGSQIGTPSGSWNSISAFAPYVTTSSPMPGGTVSTPYSQAVAATLTTGSVTWTLRTGEGTLPPGLTISSGGTISGTPTQAGTYTFRVRGRDTTGAFAEKAMQITVT